ncbi:Sin3 associated polypeptide p18-domain-containing protein [Hypoxylon fragiforme]|uniref:Sin3 associated polypeptide p18-domain-containing protein n=1 Tax=Hypoxylon fragiforme TaxID=63214 RepID=UPI0020C6459E|nr:Sin3 associated polypeptide p18-domain-containing protein [Hypoxylon fragiforme]KAI2612470.1 Sin3 associated polypeptide p18-domain-containing protein [Hypoxylon fragiforme]
MNRHTTPPFMLRLFYRTGAFHRPDEFTTERLPPHIGIHAWNDSTLTELTYIIAAAKPNLIPNPAVGTRVAFRLIFPDTRTNAAGQTTARYSVKDLGSVVIGDGYRGLDPEDIDEEKKLDTEGDKTLLEARFVVGDFISCAILPPLADGSVAPTSSARSGLGGTSSESRAMVGRPPGNMFGARERENGNPRSARDRNSGRGYDRFGNRSVIPSGEWRRGERLPEPPAAGRGRREGRY